MNDDTTAADPRLHVFLLVPGHADSRSQAGDRQLPFAVRPLTDSDGDQFTAEWLDGSWNMPASCGRPYAGIEDAVAVLTEQAANPPDDVDPDDLRACIWEAHVGLGWTFDQAADQGVQPHFAVVAAVRWHSAEQRHVVETYTPSARYYVVAEQPDGKPRSHDRDARNPSLEEVAHRENPGTAVYDLHTGRHITVPAPAEREASDRVRAPAERPPRGEW